MKLKNRLFHEGRDAASKRGASALVVLPFLAVLWCSAASGDENPGPELAPLTIGTTGRYLADRNNRPFLVVGDTAWSLIAQVKEQDIERYLEDRQKRGFNSIIVNLIEHKFCDSPPRTRAGLAPFSKPGDFSTPNRKYFDFAAKVIEKANRQGIVVWLFPAYLGFGGGDEGFFREIKTGGKEKLRSYGAFIGQRFRSVPNIVWVLGGDHTPEVADQWTITELGRAIHQADTNHLMTVHAAPETAAAAVFGAQDWLTVNTVYSYKRSLVGPVLAEYARKPARPFVLIESTYEGEHNSTPEQIRRQAYWTILGGGGGQFFGNNPIWHFDGPGLFPADQTWIQALDAQGSRDMSRLRAFFFELPWHELRPEADHAVITDGYGQDTSACLTALTADHRIAVTYVPSEPAGLRSLTVNVGDFPRSVVARWHNPATGTVSAADGSPWANQGLRTCQTPRDKDNKASDWLLVLDAR